MAIIHATDATFAGLVTAASQPVIVDFWAAWCGPCRQVAPELAALAAKYDGRLDVVKVDVDANPLTSAAFDIQSIPTIVFFRPGASPVGVLGFQTVEQLEAAFGLADL